MIARFDVMALVPFLLIALPNLLPAQDTVECRKGTFGDPNIPVLRCGIEMPSVSNCATSGTCVPMLYQEDDGIWVTAYLCQGGESSVNSPLFFSDEKNPPKSTHDDGGKAWSLHRRWCVRIYDCDRFCLLSATSPPVCILAGPNDEKSRYIDFYVPVKNNAGTQLDCPEPTYE